MPYVQRHYTLRFLTPAFLGNAEQVGEWRTPPFKAQLRQWWRVAFLKGREPTPELISQMRETEGRLFGNAWLDPNADERAKGRKVGHCRSGVRIRLEGGDPPWSPGTQRGVAPLATGLETSYAWFGLIKRKDGATKQPLPDRTAVMAGGAEGERVLKIAFPEEHRPELEMTLRLLHGFGQVGSRARTGWGAIHLDGIEPLSAQELRLISRSAQQCLETDWAHAFGRDEQGIWIWESAPAYANWATALAEAAILRKKVRTILKGNPDLRHFLGFAAADSSRMASPLRWRVIKPSKENKLALRVFALPHKIPVGCQSSRLNPRAVSAWTAVVRALDATHGLRRWEAKA